MKIPKIEKTQNSQYYCRLRIGGQSISVYGSTEKECREQATLIKAKHKAGQLEEKKAELTLSKAIDNYIAARTETRSPATLRGYKIIQDNRFQSVMNLPLSNSINWQKVVNDEAKLCSPHTLKNAWSLACSAMKEAGYPAPAFKTAAIVPSEAAFLQPEEIPVFIEALRGQSFEVAALLGLHGLRRSEIYAVTWDDLDLKENTIHVRGAVVPNMDGEYFYKDANKNAASRRNVPIMIPRLKELLLELQGQPILTESVNNLSKKIKRTCERAGVTIVTAHGLRHSFVSLAYHLGLSELECMRLGGYADAATMRKIYTHLSEADRNKAASKIAKFYESAAAQPAKIKVQKRQKIKNAKRNAKHI